jgi:hypothetical protein
MSTSSLIYSPVACLNKRSCCRVILSASLRTNQKSPIKPSDQRANERQVHNLIRRQRCLTQCLPPPLSLPFCEPFLLNFRSKITDEEFDTKAHYCTCEADFVLTAWDFAAVRKSMFTWKTELSSAKLKIRNLA